MENKGPILMSLFELLKAGPGPSSSHTIAPMKAGADFLSCIKNLDNELIKKAQGVCVRLFGSLSATGKGHGTDRAIIAGLIGYEPQHCPANLLSNLENMPQEKRLLKLGDKQIVIGFENIKFDSLTHDFPYRNTLIIELLDKPYPKEENGNVLFSREYYSVGGGFLQWKNWKPLELGKPAYVYSNMKEFQEQLIKHSIPPYELLMRNEMAITGEPEHIVNQKLDEILELMVDSVKRGLKTEGYLPGNIRLMRKAHQLNEKAKFLQKFERDLCFLDSYAYGAAEENAAGNTIVTAPTCGACGVVPSILMFMREHLNLSIDAQRYGLMAATLIGFIAKHNAAIAGAEVGCQGEIGVATAMGAAMLAQAQGHSSKAIENAAEIALEHQLGLTCDPVGGYVQIPCIERNAMGAVKAYNAAIIAGYENPNAHMVSFDDTVEAMKQIGHDMNCKFKETATGGLAVCTALC